MPMRGPQELASEPPTPNPAHPRPCSLARGEVVMLLPAEAAYPAGRGEASPAPVSKGPAGASLGPGTALAPAGGVATRGPVPGGCGSDVARQ